jgi:hypothetical protein
MNLLDLLGDAAAIAANPIAGLAKVALDVAPDIASLFGDDAEKGRTQTPQLIGDGSKVISSW